MVSLASDTISLRCDGGGASGTSNQFQVIPDASNQLLQILPGQTYAPGHTSGKVGNTTAQQAGADFNVSVYITDQWHNQINNASDSVSLSSTDPYKPIQKLALASGSASILYNFRKAGNQRFFARDITNLSIRPDTSSTIYILPGTYSRLLVIFPGEDTLTGDTTTALANTPGKIGTPSPQYLLESFNVTVYSTDTMWNITATTNFPIYLNCNLPFSSNSPQYLVNGNAQFAACCSTKGDNQILWARDVTNNITSYNNMLSIDARTTSISALADPDTVQPGVTAYINATIYDRTGAPIEGKRVQFSVLSGHGVILADYDTVYTDAAGYCQSRFICQSGFFNEQDTIGITADGYTDRSSVVFIMIPDSSVMGGNLVAFPNPFGSINSNRQTQFMYYLSSSCNVIYAIYDPFGNLVLREDIAPGQNGARQGINIITWDGRNDKHKRVATGVYYVVFKGYMHTNVFLEKRIKVGVIW